MDLLDCAADHRRGAMDPPAHQVPGTVAVLYLGKPLLDRPEFALLLMRFAGAFRRSELIALELADITDTDDGLPIAVHHSNADQEGEGGAVGLPYGSNPATCPVQAWRA